MKRLVVLILISFLLLFTGCAQSDRGNTEVFLKIVYSSSSIENVVVGNAVFDAIEQLILVKGVTITEGDLESVLSKIVKQEYNLQIENCGTKILITIGNDAKYSKQGTIILPINQF